MECDCDGALNTDIYSSMPEAAAAVGTGHAAKAADGFGSPGGSGAPAPSATGGGATAEQSEASVAKAKPKCGRQAGTKSCKGCNQLFPLSVFPANSVFCWKDKRALDCIGKQCRDNEEEKEWLSQVRSDPKRVRRMLASYHEACALASTGKQGKAKAGKTVWCLAQFRMSITASTSVKKVSRGRMMSKDDFLKKEIREGRLAADADRNWSNMLADETIPRDEAGPAHSRLRLRIHLGDDMDIEENYAISKELQLEEKKVKVTDAEQLRKMSHNVLVDHAPAMDAAGTMSIDDAAGRLAMAGPAGRTTQDIPRGSSAFADKNLVIASVRDLLPESEPRLGGKAASADAQSDEREEVEGGGDSGQEPQKTPKFWPADRAVAAAQQSAINQANKVTQTVEQASEELGELLEALAAMPEEERRTFLKEERLLQNRQEFLKAVLSPQETSLHCAKMHMFHRPPQGAPGANVELMAQSPCRDLQDLVTCTRLQSEAEALTGLTRKALAQAQADFQKRKRVTYELVTAAKAVAKDFARARKARERLTAMIAKKAESGGGAPAPPKDSRAGHQPLVRAKMSSVETASDVAAIQPIPTVPWDTISGAPNFQCDFTENEPFVVSAAEVAADIEGAVGGLLQEFAASFAEFAAKGLGTRGQKAIEDTGNLRLVEEKMLRLFPTLARLPRLVTGNAGNPGSTGSGDEALDRALAEKCLQPVLVAASAASEVHSTEKESLASVRLTVWGSRHILLTPAMDLISFMHSREPASAAVANPNSLQRAYMFLKHMTPQVMAEYAAAHPAWHAFLSPGDAVYVPPAFVFGEFIATAGPVAAVGFRMCFLTSARVKEYMTLRDRLKAVQKDVTHMDTAIQVFQKMLADAIEEVRVPPASLRDPRGDDDASDRSGNGQEGGGGAPEGEPTEEGADGTQSGGGAAPEGADGTQSGGGGAPPQQPVPKRRKKEVLSMPKGGPVLLDLLQGKK